MESVEEISKTADDRMYKSKWLYYQKKGIDRSKDREPIQFQNND